MVKFFLTDLYINGNGLVILIIKYIPLKSQHSLWSWRDACCLSYDNDFCLYIAYSLWHIGAAQVRKSNKKLDKIQCEMYTIPGYNLHF